MDAFAAVFSTDLANNGNDAVAYFGGAGERHDATAMASRTARPGWSASAAKRPRRQGIGQDGYVAQINMARAMSTGASTLTGKDGYAPRPPWPWTAPAPRRSTPFGLPAGHARLRPVAEGGRLATAARAGDTFQIRTRDGGNLKTITIEANDTLETLAAKIRRRRRLRAPRSRWSAAATCAS
jgi:hypothetical protein